MADRPPTTLFSRCVSVVIPVLNEEEALPELLQHLASCVPPPFEIIVSDGGSTDRTVAVAKEAKARVLTPADESSRGSTSEPKSCRALSLNRGLAAATGRLIVFVHADTLPPDDFVVQVCDTMADGHISLGAFRTITVSDHGGDKKAINRIITAHHFIKTYYVPLFVAPFQMMRGLRALTGDQCIFVRREQMLEVGGFDLVPLMEDVMLCKKMVQFGRQSQINATCTTLDRRIALYGTLRITMLRLFIAFGSELGIPLSWLLQFYPPQHELEECQRLAFFRSRLHGNSMYETRILWNEIVRDRSYDHEILSLPATGGTVVDVGANIGIFSLWAASCKVKDATIHAIEPSPHTFQLLETNAALGNIVRGNHIKVHQLALSRNAKGSLPLTTYPRFLSWTTLSKDETVLYHDVCCVVSNIVTATVGSFLSRLVQPFIRVFLCPLMFSFLSAGATTVNVRITSLSQFMKEQAIESIDLLKVDVERHEYQILLGISDEDWSKIKAVVIEAEVQHNEIRELLQNHGFQVEEKWDELMDGAPHSIIWGLRSK